MLITVELGKFLAIRILKIYLPEIYRRKLCNLNTNLASYLYGLVEQYISIIYLQQSVLHLLAKNAKL